VPPTPVANIVRSTPHEFVDLALDEPVRKRAQLDGTGPDLQPFKVEVTFDRDVSHRNGQHLLVHVNPRDVIRHRPLLVGAKSVPRRINQGRELSPRENTATLNYSVNHARSGSNSCSASLAPWLIPTSPFPTPAFSEPTIFMSFRGPVGSAATSRENHPEHPRLRRAALRALSLR
jgi:hypothetical protein